jgi:TRAP-type mannitol/chloroaromatic compound transport system permease small subunit
MTEMVGALLVPIIFLSLSDGWKKKGTFVAAEFLLSKMSGRLRWWFILFIELFALLFFTMILGYAAFLETVYKYRTLDVLGSLGEYFPSWPFQLSIAIGFMMLAVRHLLTIIFHVKGYHNADSR